MCLLDALADADVSMLIFHTLQSAFWGSSHFGLLSSSSPSSPIHALYSIPSPTHTPLLVAHIITHEDVHVDVWLERVHVALTRVFGEKATKPCRYEMSRSVIYWLSRCACICHVMWRTCHLSSCTCSSIMSTCDAHVTSSHTRPLVGTPTLTPAVHGPSSHPHPHSQHTHNSPHHYIATASHQHVCSLQANTRVACILARCMVHG